jgi:hypothetical protein
MFFKTVGDLRRAIKNLDDEYTIDLRVRRELSELELSNMLYPYPYITDHNCVLEFDDVGVSDKVMCIGVDITNIDF